MLDRGSCIAGEKFKINVKAVSGARRPGESLDYFRSALEMTPVWTPAIVTLGDLATTLVDKHHTRAQNECQDSARQLDSSLELHSRVALLPESAELGWIPTGQQ